MTGLPVLWSGFSPNFSPKAFIKSKFSWAFLGIGSFAFRARHFDSAVLYVLSPSELKQYIFPPMDASTADGSVHLLTGKTGGNTEKFSILSVSKSKSAFRGPILLSS